MDTTSLYYFKELTKDLNVTHAARRLYLSQQTLSNHISRLEKWCGTPLFYRKPRLALTPAGRYLLQYAEHTLMEEQQMKDTVSDIAEEQQGTIRFGASYARYYTLLPEILPALSEKYPNVSLDITDDNAAPLITKMLSGDLDIILSPRKDILPTLDSTLLMATTVYLCVADSLLTRYYGEEAAALKEKSRHGANLADFSKLPFISLRFPTVSAAVLPPVLKKPISFPGSICRSKRSGCPILLLLPVWLRRSIRPSPWIRKSGPWLPISISFP